MQMSRSEGQKSCPDFKFLLDMKKYEVRLSLELTM